MKGLEFLVSLSSLFAISCTTITMQPQDAEVRHYFGYVKVIVPAVHSPASGFVASDITSVGMKVGQGITIGYQNDAEVFIPMDCRMVILVKTREQLERAISSLNANLLREDLCMAVH